MKDTFSSYHPLVNFLYFALVLTFSMLFLHPVCLAVSILCAFIYALYLNGGRALLLQLKYLLPILLLTVLINPLFNHAGVTILVYLPSGNALTLESVYYGAATGVMLTSVILWFSCYNTVMTSDKFICLFGRIIPSLSLVLSMTLRFIPRFRTQLRLVSDTQKCLSRNSEKNRRFHRIRHGILVLSIMLSWTMESSIETADSMKSRGFGLPGRSAFSIFIFSRRDWSMLIFLLLIGIYIGVGATLGGFGFSYFPALNGAWRGLYSISLFLCYFLLCVSPVIINKREDRIWRVIRSKI